MIWRMIHEMWREWCKVMSGDEENEDRCHWQFKAICQVEVFYKLEDKVSAPDCMLFHVPLEEWLKGTTKQLQ